MRGSTVGNLVAFVVAGVATALVPAARSIAATPLPADIAVFGQQPAHFRDGVTPFPASGSIFQYQREADDPVTRLKFQQVSGLKNHLGQMPDRITSFGKYVLMGSSPTTSVGGDPVDHTIGVFDSESKTFCSLVVDPTHPSSTNNLATANPNARKSRILLGTGAKFGSPGETAFAAVLADLDAPNPCAWTVVRATATQLNAGYPASEQICPDGFCGFDSMALLAHEDVAGDPYGRDYAVVGNYFNAHLAVVRVDASGIAVVNTYGLPPFATPGSGGACYVGAPARRASGNFASPDTRPANDWRALFSFDAFLIEEYASPPPSSCAAPYPYCPLDLSGGLPGAPCPGGGSCVKGYCQKYSGYTGFQSCSVDTDCTILGVSTGPCVKTCLNKSPLFRCRNGTGGGSLRQCTTLNPSTCPAGQTCNCPAGETCTPGTAANIVFPSQEYRFDKTTQQLSPTSAMFFSAQTGPNFEGTTPAMVTYDADRTLWSDSGSKLSLYRTKTNTDNCTVGSATTVHVPTGEHCFYDTSNPTTASVVVPDWTLAFEQTPDIPHITTTAQVDTRMFVADGGSLQYAQLAYGNWYAASAATYKAGFAFAPGYMSTTDPLAATSLPAEPRRCSASNLPCDVTADCGATGGTCDALPENTSGLYSAFKFLQAGGAPTSLWVESGYYQAPPIAQTDMFLLRVPVATAIPDNQSGVRPGIAWDGDRMWLVSEHAGQLQYRVRDDGQWSSWYPLAPNNITAVGGAAVIAGASVNVYAHDAAGQVWAKTLTSAKTCTPGLCTWGSWSTLPSTVTTNDEPAATFAGSSPFVAVHSATDDGVWATVWNGTAWGAWFRVGASKTVNAAPAVAYHAPGTRVWVIGRDKVSGKLGFSKVNAANGGFSAWANLPTTGAPATWGTGAAVASDGHAVRVYGHDSAFPQWTYQIVNDGSGWSTWRLPLGGSWGTFQPAAANVNGEIDVMTNWYTGGLQEVMLP